MNSTKTAIEEHWRALEDGNTEAEHAIYAVDAILDYPQSGERSEVARRLLRNVAGTPPSGTSRCYGSQATAICG
jgi:hypothetical protein